MPSSVKSRGPGHGNGPTTTAADEGLDDTVVFDKSLISMVSQMPMSMTSKDGLGSGNNVQISCPIPPTPNTCRYECEVGGPGLSSNILTASPMPELVNLPNDIVRTSITLANTNHGNNNNASNFNLNQNFQTENLNANGNNYTLNSNITGGGTMQFDTLHKMESSSRRLADAGFGIGGNTNITGLVGTGPVNHSLSSNNLNHGSHSDAISNLIEQSEAQQSLSHNNIHTTATLSLPNNNQGPGVGSVLGRSSPITTIGQALASAANIPQTQTHSSNLAPPLGRSSPISAAAGDSILQNQQQQQVQLQVNQQQQQQQFQKAPLQRLKLLKKKLAQQQATVNNNTTATGTAAAQQTQQKNQQISYHATVPNLSSNVQNNTNGNTTSMDANNTTIPVPIPGNSMTTADSIRQRSRSSVVELPNLQSMSNQNVTQKPGVGPSISLNGPPGPGSVNHNVNTSSGHVNTSYQHNLNNVIQCPPRAKSLGSGGPFLGRVKKKSYADVPSRVDSGVVNARRSSVDHTQQNHQLQDNNMHNVNQQQYLNGNHNNNYGVGGPNMNSNLNNLNQNNLNLNNNQDNHHHDYLKSGSGSKGCHSTRGQAKVNRGQVKGSAGAGNPGSNPNPNRKGKSAGGGKGGPGGAAGNTNSGTSVERKMSQNQNNLISQQNRNQGNMPENQNATSQSGGNSIGNETINDNLLLGAGAPGTDSEVAGPNNNITGETQNSNGPMTVVTNSNSKPTISGSSSMGTEPSNVRESENLSTNVNDSHDLNQNQQIQNFNQNENHSQQGTSESGHQQVLESQTQQQYENQIGSGPESSQSDSLTEQQQTVTVVTQNLNEGPGQSHSYRIGSPSERPVSSATVPTVVVNPEDLLGHMNDFNTTGGNGSGTGPTGVTESGTGISQGSGQQNSINLANTEDLIIAHNNPNFRKNNNSNYNGGPGVSPSGDSGPSRSTVPNPNSNTSSNGNLNLNKVVNLSPRNAGLSPRAAGRNYSLNELPYRSFQGSSSMQSQSASQDQQSQQSQSQSQSQSGNLVGNSNSQNNQSNIQGQNQNLMNLGVGAEPGVGGHGVQDNQSSKDTVPIQYSKETNNNFNLQNQIQNQMNLTPNSNMNNIMSNNLNGNQLGVGPGSMQANSMNLVQNNNMSNNMNNVNNGHNVNANNMSMMNINMNVSNPASAHVTPHISPNLSQQGVQNGPGLGHGGISMPINNITGMSNATGFQTSTYSTNIAGANLTNLSSQLPRGMGNNNMNMMSNYNNSNQNLQNHSSKNSNSNQEQLSSNDGLSEDVLDVYPPIQQMQQNMHSNMNNMGQGHQGPGHNNMPMNLHQHPQNSNFNGNANMNMNNNMQHMNNMNNMSHMQQQGQFQNNMNQAQKLNHNMPNLANMHQNNQYQNNMNQIQQQQLQQYQNPGPNYNQSQMQNTPPLTTIHSNGPSPNLGAAQNNMGNSNMSSLYPQSHGPGVGQNHHIGVNQGPGAQQHGQQQMTNHNNMGQNQQMSMNMNQPNSNNNNLQMHQQQNGNLQVQNQNQNMNQNHSNSVSEEQFSLQCGPRHTAQTPHFGESGMIGHTKNSMLNSGGPGPTLPTGNSIANNNLNIPVTVPGQGSSDTSTNQNQNLQMPGMQLDPVSGLWIPTREEARVECPYCNRKFNEEASIRHIPKCKEVQHRPKGLGSQGVKYKINKLGQRIALDSSVAGKGLGKGKGKKGQKSTNSANSNTAASAGANYRTSQSFYKLLLFV